MNIVYKYLYPLLGVIVAVLILVLGFIVIRDLLEEEETQSSTPTEETSQNNQDTEIDEFTLEQVAEGNTRENCLLAYQGGVYLVTEEYFSEHPGGANSIVRNCGTDVTEAFNSLHSATGTAFVDLENYRVGNLVEASNGDLGLTVETFTLAEVNAANTIDNCLIVYSGDVYRIPSTWANEHPGGSANIINSCGTDVTTAFERAHSGNQDAFSQIEEYFAGTLEN